MQPYFFPYLGYFQLINAVDTFVVYDDAQFSKGWINRNKILVAGRPHYITLPVRHESRILRINERSIADPDGRYRRHIIKTLATSYAHAPYRDETLRLVEETLSLEDMNLATFLENSIRHVCDRLGIATTFVRASSLNLQASLRGKERLMAICRCLEAEVYINPIGGMGLYKKEDFAAYGITLKFLEMMPLGYGQRNVPVAENLSIIDVLMFNDRKAIASLLKDYHLH
jgi:hypothetical protein